MSTILVVDMQTYRRVLLGIFRGDSRMALLQHLFYAVSVMSKGGLERCSQNRVLVCAESGTAAKYVEFYHR